MSLETMSNAAMSNAAVLNANLNLLVKSVTYETSEIRLYELRDPEGGDLPRFKAGAHVDLHLSNGLIRSYSLVNSEADCRRYLVGVAKDRNSRGGSSHIHRVVSAGDLVPVSQPRNNFPLDEGDHETVLIAGGIGITPMLSMVDRLQYLGRNWQLYLAARTRKLTAFQHELSRYGDRVTVHCDDEHNGAVLDIAKLIASARPNTHFYCCGPAVMLTAYQAAASGIPQERVHLEHFSALDNAATEGGFCVELAKSDRVLMVKKGKTILDAVLEAGIDVPFSCQAGVCGICQTRVLSGTPDHRDLFLSPSEQSSNETIMICCSGSQSEKLVLDL